MIVPEPPPAAACAMCVRPLVWLYHATSQRWISFATDSTDRDTVHVHRCRRDREDTDWRSVRPVPPEKLRAGMAMVRAELARVQRAKSEPETPRPAWAEPTRALSVITPRSTE